ncbi:hypothetical protein AB434_1519 [Heyndrickxia coagulans]|nr:hypothetical protein AB434_1519 [Heyndrickxia coagulans]
MVKGSCCSFLKRCCRNPGEMKHRFEPGTTEDIRKFKDE